MPIPDLQIDPEDLLFSDPRPCPIPEIIEPEIISYPEAISAAASGDTDIRPRVFDGTDNAPSSALPSSGKAPSSGQNSASRPFLFSKSSQ